jgi:UDP-N-acetylenolpyruvoylglucosamine reductase
MPDELKTKLQQIFPNTIFNVDLTDYQNYLKPSGKCWALCSIENLDTDFLQKLSKLTKLKKEFNFPIKVIGKHTNIIFTERGFHGLLLIIDRKNISSDDVVIKDNIVIVNNPVPLAYLVTLLSEKGFDLSCLIGIPGTVFSAILNNSGANTSGMSTSSSNVRKIITYDLQEDCIKEFIPDEKFFSIRSSLLKELNYKQTRYVILQVEISPVREEVSIIKDKINETNKRRSIVNREGYQYHTAGSFWSNGHALKATGKRVREMGAECGIQDIIIDGIGYTSNFGFLYTSATTTDKQLASYTKKTFDTIKNKFNYELHAEVEIIDQDGQISISDFWKQILI